MPSPNPVSRVERLKEKTRKAFKALSFRRGLGEV